MNIYQQYMNQKTRKSGGFIITIPTLLAGIGAVASMAGAAGGIAKAVNDKKHNDKMESEAKRHNKKVENLLLANTNTRKGAYLPRKTAKGVFYPGEIRPRFV